MSVVNFDTVIGLEVHVQLCTSSKIFCSSPAAFGAEPNTNVDPLSLGLPGSLPVLNRAVVESAMLLGLALDCEIRRHNHFARKHYFYPDLPKGYQISQLEEPICERGNLQINIDDSVRSVGITRIHMEEDAGKSLHDGANQTSLVDLNRAGVPLLEVVSEPDLRSPAEAVAYLRTLRQIVRYLRISDGNMEEGSLRCDANISLRPHGSSKYGIRTEIKNLNSFRFVEHALEYEVARQLKILRGGGDVVQETRLYDSVSDTTQAMRGKEESADYRYFPDPDLPPLLIEERWIAELTRKMPKLPEQRYQEFVTSYGLSNYDASLLTSEREYADYFEIVFNTCSNAKAACNWITTELFGSLKKAHCDFEACPILPRQLGEMIQLIDDRIISGKMAKQVFEEMFKSGKTAHEVIEERGLQLVTDRDVLRQYVEEAFNSFPKQLEQFLGGVEKIQAFFVGKVMQMTKGNASPQLVNEAIELEVLRRRKQR